MHKISNKILRRINLYAYKKHIIIAHIINYLVLQWSDKITFNEFRRLFAFQLAVLSNDAFLTLSGTGPNRMRSKDKLNSQEKVF